jgi:acyl-CoA thioester hydrolase
MQHIPRTRVVFEYEIRNQDDVLLNVGETTLVFQKMENAKLCIAPEKLLEKLNPYFQI